MNLKTIPLECPLFKLFLLTQNVHFDLSTKIRRILTGWWRLAPVKAEEVDDEDNASIELISPKLQDKTVEEAEEMDNHKEEDKHVPTLSNESKDEDVASIFIKYKGNLDE